jgi:hypothetical protein
MNRGGEGKDGEEYEETSEEQVHRLELGHQYCLRNMN